MQISKLLAPLLLFLAGTLSAQDYPPNPKPGMCYIRCKKELVEQTVKQVVVPFYKEYKIVPAVYETVNEQIVVKPASKRFEIVPAVYKDVIDTIMIEDPINKITLVPIKTIDTFEVLEIQPAYAQFESKPGVLNCKSKNPRDCDVICYVQYEAVKKQIPVKKIVANPTFVKEVKEGKFKILKRKELVSAPVVKEIEIPAEYITIKRKALVKDETLDSSDVGAIYREEVRLVRDETDGGAESEYVWEEIDCNLTDLNILPIYYDFDSAELSSDAKSIIDEKLFNLMVKKPLIRIEVNAHTDSRASADFNLDLSERRARAVVNYLVSKGIKRSRLEYHGLGETVPVNHCTDGVNCSEAGYAKNRRTEFRVLTQ